MIASSPFCAATSRSPVIYAGIIHPVGPVRPSRPRHDGHCRKHNNPAWKCYVEVDDGQHVVGGHEYLGGRGDLEKLADFLHVARKNQRALAVSTNLLTGDCIRPSHVCANQVVAGHVPFKEAFRLHAMNFLGRTKRSRMALAARTEAVTRIVPLIGNRQRCPVQLRVVTKMAGDENSIAGIEADLIR